MPVVEKYGLMVLFGLCALIVSVGIFAEDPLAKEALAQKQGAVQEPIDEFEAQEEQESVVFNDSDWVPARPESPGGEGLMAYSPPSRDTGMGPDPKRESSLGDLPRSMKDISEKGGRQAADPKLAKPEKKPQSKPVTRSYVVKKGDSLGRIARKQLGSARYADEIRRVNPQIKNDVIYAGKTIWIPVLGGDEKAKVANAEPSKKAARSGKTRYITVKKGETLMAIAKREYGDQSKWKALARRNGIRRDKDLRDSQKLLIPADL